MRTRETIEKEKNKEWVSVETEKVQLAHMQLEVLLDIRDLLSQEKPLEDKE